MKKINLFIGMLVLSGALKTLSMENKAIMTIGYDTHQLKNVRKDWLAKQDNMTKPCEDRHSIVTQKENKVGFFAAVYDGNGGSSVAEHLKQKLPEYFFYDLAQQCGVKSVEKAFKNAFGLITNDLFAIYKKDFAEIDNRDSYPGSTAVCVFVDLENIVHFSWIGDSRGIVGECSEKEKVLTLKELLYATKDHNLFDENEKKRIIEKGGLIETYEKALYVNEITMTRVIGAFDKTNLEIHDKTQHTPQGYGMILADPDYHCVRLEKDKAYIIALVSDGVTDVISDDNEILKEIMAKGICRVVQKARKGTDDDITVIKIDINT